ncbi:copper transporter [Sphaerisporangium sp. TRM90804]|uniref:copper transporter n=1 Tax=Sphaerisporangium sp. TRM90804 TaxID=3031113 RepID=UPI002446AD1A|nr:copper transporter [Sphaerisporangium sp. TRM90804]MDH2430295.1 copper transporter [Sphaerisporangium sp. TRM90804]
MIDFRYHIVSIVAIFLALAIGIVLGSTVLNAPLVRLTEETAARLQANNTKLQDDVARARTRGAASDAFLTERLPQLVQTSLAGERVLVVEAPGADSRLREPLQQVLLAAGATLSGQVVLNERFVDVSQSAVIDQLATTAKPADLAFAANATPYDKVAAVLGSAVMTNDKAQSGKENPGATGVLDALESDGLLSVEGDPAKRATLAVLVPPAVPFEGKDAEAQTTAIVSMAGGLDEAGEGAVVAGVVPTSTAAGVIAAVRESGDMSTRVSTVDNVDMAFGRAVVVYALREQVAGDSDQYGLGSDAASVAPIPSPTPTPTPDAGSGG